MKAYGANKATEFTRKQIGVIYRMAKNGDLNVEKWYMNRLYDLADFYGYDYNRSVEDVEGRILKILEKVFAGETSEVQDLISADAERSYNLYGRKMQARCNREMFV